jgi:enoyl-CoA hydratase/carnithine racemase
VELEHFLLEEDGAVATLTFNRPERRNGLNAAVLRELEAALCHLRDGGAVRALILTGNGPAFCAGAEPAAVASASPSQHRQATGSGPRVIGRVFELLAHLEIFTVAAVNGAAVGGGWTLALATDHCLAVPGALFWVPEVELGAPFRGSPVFALTARMGPWLAKEAAILCRRFSAEELAALGIVNAVVPADSLLRDARAVADRFVALPRSAAVSTKRDINAHIYGPRHI